MFKTERQHWYGVTI